jgi:hypothetical protein
MDKDLHKTPVHKKFTAQQLTTAGVSTFLLVTGVFIYAWVTLANNNSLLTAEVKKLKSDLISAQASNTTLKDTITSMSAQQAKTAYPVAALISAKHYNGTRVNPENDGKILYGNEDFLLVKIELQNNSDKAAVFAPNDFKLKEGNLVYPYYTNSAVGGEPRFATGVSYLPAGYIELKAQTLMPKEKISGTLIFYVPQTSKTFQLYYYDQKFDIQAK